MVINTFIQPTPRRCSSACACLLASSPKITLISSYRLNTTPQFIFHNTANKPLLYFVDLLKIISRIHSDVYLINANAVNNKFIVEGVPHNGCNKLLNHVYSANRMGWVGTMNIMIMNYELLWRWAFFRVYTISDAIWKAGGKQIMLIVYLVSLLIRTLVLGVS